MAAWKSKLVRGNLNKDRAEGLLVSNTKLLGFTEGKQVLWNGARRVSRSHCEGSGVMTLLVCLRCAAQCSGLYGRANRCVETCYRTNKDRAESVLVSYTKLLGFTDGKQSTVERCASR